MRVLLTGASGQLGAYLLNPLISRGHDLVAWSGRCRDRRSGVNLESVDLTRIDRLEDALTHVDPAVVLHAAAVSNPKAVLEAPDRAEQVNVEATRQIADWCARRDRRLIFTSTDMVFDGCDAPYGEDDPTHPLSQYGHTKVKGERIVRAIPGGLVARITLQYGPTRIGRPGFFDGIVRGLHRNEPQTLFIDEYRTPLDYLSTAEILAELADREDIFGTLNVAGPDRLSRLDLFERVCRHLKIDVGLLLGNRMTDLRFSEPRPVDTSMRIDRLLGLELVAQARTVEQAVDAWRDEIKLTPIE